MLALGYMAARAAAHPAALWLCIAHHRAARAGPLAGGAHVPPPCPFVELAAARPELFAFAVGASAYRSWDRTCVTTVALFGGNANNLRAAVAAPAGLLCEADAHGARLGRLRR